MALRKDGREFLAEIAIGPTEDGGCTIALVRDITETLATRGRLQAAEDRYETILRSLDSHLAVIDPDGRITVVNAAWEDFARDNDAASAPSVGVGANYLEVCGTAAETDPDVEKALAGIRSVLDGSRPHFEMEYPCHSPSQKRWFLMTAAPLRSGKGAVIRHTDLTAQVVLRQKLEDALAEVSRLKDRLESEAEYLRQEVRSEHDFENILGRSGTMRATLWKLEQVAPTDSTVLIVGETGSGKELLARAIHARSGRKGQPFVKVDCTTLPSGLVESELFGHTRGAFTGALESRSGRFEQADGGTIFLDEIGELPLELQGKLLRVLQDGEYEPLGGKGVRRVDVRVIAATNRDLRREMEEGRFRPDLYYRLSVVLLESPPLRERREDIPLLVSYFVDATAAAVGKVFDSIDEASMAALMAYDWPGNVRELQNVIERAVVLSPPGRLTVRESFGNAAAARGAHGGSLDQDLMSVERSRILKALEESGWKVKGAGGAAARLGLKPTTLQSRMKKLEIQRPA
jgi:transcriptional regulator with GAF, ATPase, and Fis domain